MSNDLFVITNDCPFGSFRPAVVCGAPSNLLSRNDLRVVGGFLCSVSTLSGRIGLQVKR